MHALTRMHACVQPVKPGEDTTAATFPPSDRKAPDWLPVHVRCACSPSGPAFTLGARLPEPKVDASAGVDAPGPGQYYSPGGPDGPAFTMGAKFKGRWVGSGQHS